MFFNRDKKRILSLAERLVGTAAILALSIDKALDAVSQDADVPYGPMRPDRLFVYTVAGTGMAVLTAATGPMQKVGKDRFEQAVDRGLLGHQRSISKLIPTAREFFQKSTFDAAMADYMKASHAYFAEGASAPDAAGLWIWENMREGFSPSTGGDFGERVVQIAGNMVVGEFGPYWLTESEIRAMRRRGPRHL